MKLVLVVLALLVSPVAWAGPQAKSDDAEAHNNLGLALEQKGVRRSRKIARRVTSIRMMK